MTEPTGTELTGKQILLVITGGIAAYKSLELIRLIRKSGGTVKCILTKGGEQFVTPLSVAALSEHEVYTQLWSLKDEAEMGHIRLTRDADLIVIAPASANIIAKIANGIADDLASTTLLASDKIFLFAPAMNHKMWSNEATKENVKKLEGRGHTMIAPTEGDMACGEFGVGRLAEPADILSVIQSQFKKKALSGFKALVTSGPTHEPLDPVRFIGNRSSGKQGHAIARALHKAGADVTLVTGPVALPDPAGIKTIHVETAREMLAACETALPADIAVCAAAVADWRPDQAQPQKMKKRGNGDTPDLHLVENPDILKTLAGLASRPRLVVGFAAETTDTLAAAQAKLLRKGCDWIVANEVGTTQNPAFGADDNRVILVKRTSQDVWPVMSKDLVADRLVADIITTLTDEDTHGSGRNRISKTGKR